MSGGLSGDNVYMNVTDDCRRLYGVTLQPYWMTILSTAVMISLSFIVVSFLQRIGWMDQSEAELTDEQIARGQTKGTPTPKPAPPPATELAVTVKPESGGK